MLGITRLYASRNTPSDGLRYGRQGTEGVRAQDIVRVPHVRTAGERRPVVVWNIGRRCNLHCRHCYSDSANRPYFGELTTAEGFALIDDLAAFGVPVLLLSGGEPLMRPDVFDLLGRARERGVRTTLSTNGTLITPEVAARLKEIGLGYVGISLDGIGPSNDRFRGHRGAFERAVAGFRNLKAVGQRVGLRMTLTRHTARDLPEIFAFVESEAIERVCFYHLVYSGRGRFEYELAHHETRRAMDMLLDWARSLAVQGRSTEVLTVDNPADGPYLYLRLSREDPARAEEALTLLRWNGGGLHGSGVGIGNVDFRGNVHPDQFWSSVTLGNVRERPFSEIWQQSTHPILLGLRDRAARLGGRCCECQWKDVCGGGFRVRAEQVYGDPWAEDPACYLTDEERGLVAGSRIREPFAAVV